MRALRFGLAAMATLGLAAIATALIAENPDEGLSPDGVVAVTVGVAFALSGLVAMWRRSDNRTGRLMAAVGYIWFVGALAAATNDWLFTIGYVGPSLAVVAFVMLLLAFPTGHLTTRLEQGIVVSTLVLLLVSNVLVTMLDPTPVPDCEECESAIALWDAPDAASAIETVSIAIGAVLVGLLVYVLARRWRAASPPLRRVLAPVFLTGGATLVVLIVVNLFAMAFPSLDRAASVAFLVVFVTVPLSFLLGVLRTRLARSSAAAAFVSLEEGAPVRDALSRALGDPALTVSYLLEARGSWVDAEGRAVGEPTASPGRSVTPIERGGRKIAAIVHDSVLDEEPDLVETVAAGAGLAVQNERLQADLRAQFDLLETVVETVPALLVVVDTEGAIVSVNPSVAATYGLGTGDDIVGRRFWDVFIAPEEREAMIARFRAAAPDFPPAEYENRFVNQHGEERVIAWRSAPVADESGEVLRIVSGGLDITERKRQEEELRASRTRLVEAESNERRRLERNLHDGAQQRLVSLALSLRLAESRLAADPAGAATVLGDAQNELSQALEELRELARGIHPAILTDRGLAPAIRALAARAPLPVEVDLPDDRLPEPVEAAAYYVVAEALTNVAKYSHASVAEVSVEQANGLVTVEVADDGDGGADATRGSGLSGLADRLAALDGTLVVVSPPGDGTRVRAVIPVHDAPLVDSTR